MSEAMKKRRICVVCTHSFTLATLYKGLFPFLETNGYEIDVVVGDREYRSFDAELFGNMRMHVIPMRRLPSLFDLVSLAGFLRFFRSRRFDVIHLSTPKASLLGSIAARLTGNGRIVFVNRRRVYELMSGWKRWFYTGVDRFICQLSDAVVPVSRGMGRQMVEEGICDESRLRFIGHGSSNGIDTDRFSPRPDTARSGAEMRAALGIPETAFVLLFLGRVCREKGVEHLAPIFAAVKRAIPDVHLVIAGPDDARDSIDPNVQAAFEADRQVHRIGYVSDPRPLFAGCDLFVFPSFFEGLANVLLESAAMEKPAVAFDVHGVREAVEEGVSGVLVPCHDDDAMSRAIIHLLSDAQERHRLGRQARERVIKLFRRDVVWQGLLSILEEISSTSHSRGGSWSDHRWLSSKEPVRAEAEDLN